MLSANEGTLPPQAPQGSYIPFSLRKAFGLLSIEEHDSLYAYYFYRLLHRSEHVHLLYNTENHNQIKAEMSRFLHQLRMEDAFKEKVAKLSYLQPLQPQTEKPITVAKTEAVIQKLYSLCTQPESKGISPSALDTLIHCSLKFYFKHLALLREPEAREEDLTALVIGNLLHETMNNLYRSIRTPGKVWLIEPEHFKDLRKEVEQQTEKAVLAYLNVESLNRWEGKNLLLKNILKEYVHSVLNTDEAYAPFEILALEAGKKYQTTLKVPAKSYNIDMKMAGIIDRIDRKNDVIRIVDYKTGNDDTFFKGASVLFEEDNKNNDKGIFQVLSYSLMYGRTTKVQPHEVVKPVLYKIKEMQQAHYDPTLKVKLLNENEVADTQPLEDVRLVMGEFERELTALAARLFDPKIPFEATKYIDNCAYCEFVDICHRAAV